MFFKKKTKNPISTEAIYDGLLQQRKDISDLHEDIVAQSADIRQLRDNSTGQSSSLLELRQILNRLASGQEDLHRAFRRQMSSFEDLLETVEEQKETSAEDAKLARDAAAREDALVEAVCLCVEQLYLLEQSLSGEKSTDTDTAQREAWKNQFAIFGRERRQICALAGIQETGIIQEPYDYRIHEGIEATETNDENLNGKIAHVYRPGFLYRGELRKKAQVSVYRYQP
ncbi:MAG: nucleotide exchange factor GrpE [Clostridiales bacterium]|nr:nucleotide exchange factor GrpE [Clostridiales bacterium]